MTEKLKGVNLTEITLYTEEDIKPGMAVMISDNYTATIPVSNTRFAGICTGVNGKYVTVAINGIVTVPYTDSEISIGYNTLASDGNGVVKIDFAGSFEYLVLDADAQKKLVTFML